MTRKLPALVLLLILIFRMAFGWTEVPGACHHDQAAQSLSASVASPCHGHVVPPSHGQDTASPCHGHTSDLKVDNGCNCGCCHLMVALLYFAPPDIHASHEPAVESPLPSDRSYISTPAHRPPIAILA